MGSILFLIIAPVKGGVPKQITSTRTPHLNQPPLFSALCVIGSFYFLPRLSYIGCIRSSDAVSSFPMAAFAGPSCSRGLGVVFLELFAVDAMGSGLGLGEYRGAEKPEACEDPVR
jgi:hypothetical protein